MELRDSVWVDVGKHYNAHLHCISLCVQIFLEEEEPGECIPKPCSRSQCKDSAGSIKYIIKYTNECYLWVLSERRNNYNTWYITRYSFIDNCFEISFVTLSTADMQCKVDSRSKKHAIVVARFAHLESMCNFRKSFQLKGWNIIPHSLILTSCIYSVKRNSIG